jgi:hypothetical protein
MKKYIIMSLFLLAGGILFSNSPLTDPSIPDNEHISYTILKGKEYSSAFQTVSKIVSDDGSSWYKIILSSPEQDIEVDIRSENLVPYRSRRVQKAGRTEYMTFSEIKYAPEVQDDEILLVDFNDLSHILRGYPFSNPRILRLVFPYNPENKDNKKDSITFKVKFIKEETVDIGSESYDSYKLQLSAKMTGGMAMFSGMVPKTFFWYSTEKPHYLLKYEGSSGMGNSERIVMEVESYEVGR